MDEMAEILRKEKVNGRSMGQSFDYSSYIFQKIKKYNETAGDLTGYDCSDCLNKGLISVLEHGDEAMKECACMEIRRSLRRIEKSGLGDLLTRYTFDAFEAEDQWQRQIKKLAQDFVIDCEGNWFFAGGQVGAGKTHLCTAVVGQLMKQGKSARYMLWRDDVVSLKASVTDDVAYSKAINELKRTDILYIDDLFKIERGKRPTTADINIAFEILNYRYNNQHLITVVSSEHTVDSLLDIDEATGSRIYERSKKYCMVTEDDRTKNYRLKKGN